MKFDYPFLGISEAGKVVLFIKSGVGIAVASDYVNPGRYAEDWIMDNFKPFDGVVELRND